MLLPLSRSEFAVQVLLPEKSPSTSFCAWRSAGHSQRSEGLLSQSVDPLTTELSAALSRIADLEETCGALEHLFQVCVGVTRAFATHCKCHPEHFRWPTSAIRDTPSSFASPLQDKVKEVETLKARLANQDHQLEALRLQILESKETSQVRLWAPPACLVRLACHLAVVPSTRQPHCSHPLYCSLVARDQSVVAMKEA